MIHTTYRRLDEPPKLCGFSFTQWLGLVVLGATVYGIESLLALPTQAAITVFAFTVGLPAALTYFSESGRPSLTRLLSDCLRWATRSKTRTPGTGTPKPLHVHLPEPKPARERKQLPKGSGGRRRLRRGTPSPLLLTTPESTEGIE